MFIDDKNIKYIENGYLDLKDIILINHKNEFSDYITRPKNELVFDSRSEYIAKFTKDCTTIEDYTHIIKQLSNYSYLQKPSKSSKEYFKDKRIALFYNFGVLTKLLGYNALYTDGFDTELGFNIMEIFNCES